MPDEQITCAACGRPFAWTAGEQRFFRERGLSQPKRCPSCRRARETAQASSSPRAATAAPPSRPVARYARRRPSPRRAFGMVTVVIAAVASAALIIFIGAPPLAAWLLGISVVTFLTYGYDKAVAGAGPTRVPEAVLLGLALIGGTFGALLGMLVFRHKTGKNTVPFRVSLAAVIAAQVVAAVIWTLIRQP